MARLSKEQWEAARTRWEGEPDLSFGQLAKELGVSRPAVSKRADEEGWEKGVTPKLSTDPKVTKVTGKLSTTGKGKTPAQPEGEAPDSALPALSHRDRELMLGRRPRGRPTEYRPEFVDEIISYFDIEVESIVDVDVVDKDGKTRTEKKTVLNTFPTITRFAAKIGVTRETLHDWATAKDRAGALKHPEFSYAYARAKDSQESLLVEGGMAGVYDPRFAVFAAKNLSGWKDQVETKSEVSITNATTSELDEIYQAGALAMAQNRAKVLARQARVIDAEDVEVRE